MKPQINAAYASGGHDENAVRVKQINNRYIKEVLNDYEKVVVSAINDWHAPQLRNAVAYKDKVNPSGCVNEQGTTFLYYASSKQDSRVDNGAGVLEVLILSGSDIFAQDESGLMPFEYAKLKNNQTNVQILQKEFDFLTRKQENRIAMLDKIKHGQYLVATPENIERVQEMKDTLELIKKHGMLDKQPEASLSEEEIAVAKRIKNYLPLISEEDVETMKGKVEAFKIQSELYKTRQEIYKEEAFRMPVPKNKKK